MGFTEIDLSGNIFTNVQAWVQMKKAGGGIRGAQRLIGGRAQRLPTKHNNNNCVVCCRLNMALRVYNIFIYIVLYSHIVPKVY